MEPGTQARSTFVTVLAWIFIALSAFATLISILQNLIVWLLIPEVPPPPALDRAPAGTTFMFGHLRGMMTVMLAILLITLVASVGLLKRKNWARLTFIGVMGMGIAAQLGGLVMQWVMVGGFPVPAADMPGMNGFGAMIIIMMVFSAVLALGLCLLFGWIIKRLVSPAVRREFTEAQPPSGSVAIGV